MFIPLTIGLLPICQITLLQYVQAITVNPVFKSLRNSLLFIDIVTHIDIYQC